MDWDLRELDKGFAAMLRAAKNLKPVWRKLEIPMEVDQESHFDARAGSEGKWPAKASATRKRDKRKGARSRSKKPLGNRMKSAFEIIIERKEMAAISKVEWAEAHQFGMRVGRGVKLPVREHLYLGERFLRRALPEINTFLVKKFGRRG